MALLLQIMLQIMLSLAAAVVAFLFMEPAHWGSIRDGAMIVFSILVAAVLFRLGRGIPPVAVDYMEIGEAKILAKTFKTIARRLSIVAGVSTAALLGLAAIGSFHQAETFYAKVLAAALAGVMAFAFYRAVMVVLGDLSSIALQSENMVNCVRRRHVREQRRHARDKIAALDEAEKDQPFKKPSNYGKIIEHH